MAMNKTEQAMLADLRRELAETWAFRRTELVLPDLPAPDYGEMNFGYRASQNGSFSTDVTISFLYSASFRHGPAKLGPDGVPMEHGRTGSQNGISLYSKASLALRGLRNKVEADAAKKLAAIDKAITETEMIEENGDRLEADHPDA